MKVLKYTVFLLLAGFTIFSVYKIIDTELDYREAEIKNQAVSDKFTFYGTNDEGCPVKVDFSGLRRENTDTVGWIYCENTEINYPVVKAFDNSFYLRRSFDGKYSIGGTVFADYRLSADLSDPHIIIYGHNMHNKSMFSILSEYSKDGFYREHPVMWLITPDISYKLKIVSGFTVYPDSDVYRLRGQEEIETFTRECIKESDFKPFEITGEIRKTVMLSTCSPGDKRKRYVVTAYAEEY